MEARHIKEVIAEALKGGNWLAFQQGSLLKEYAFCFFLSQEEAAAFCHHNTSDRHQWDVAYISSPECLLQIAKGNPQLLDSTFLKQFHMNEQNVTYLKEQLKYMGFGDKLHTALEQQVAAGKPRFQLLFQASVHQQPFEATLHFRKSDNSEFYFFNSYIAKLEKEAQQTREQTFYMNSGKGVTAKEAFNLLEGRAVLKELMDKGGHIYEAWIQLDFNSKDGHGNYLVQQYHGNYGYDLAKALSNLPIKALQNDAQKLELMKSLQKGNLQAVTLEKAGKEERVFMEANPRYKTINVYDARMNRLKKEELQPGPAKALNGKEVATYKGVQVKKETDGAKKPAADDHLLLKKKESSKKGLRP